MFITGLVIVVVGAQLGSAIPQLPRLHEVDRQESTGHCPDSAKQSSTEGCFLHDLDDAQNYRCWVTSHHSCDAGRYVGKRSLCQHTVTDVTKKCVQGEWQVEDIKRASKKRVRRACFSLFCWARLPLLVPEPVRNRDPSISCPGDVTEYAEARRTTAQVHYSYPSASDDQGQPSVSRIEGPSSGSNFREGDTVVRYRARDEHGATSECHFTVTVRVLYCGSLPYFYRGSRRCTGSRDNMYGSSCSHTCNTGYRLQGNSVVNCERHGYSPYWTSSFPTCTPVSCSRPRSVAGATVQCPAGVTFQKSCNVLCNPGFRHSGAKSITCTSSGSWTQLSPCNDVQDPAFPNGCPISKTVFSGPLRAPVALTWNDPVATDNSGHVTLNSDPAKGSRRGPGTYSVTITATDKAGNTASCSFSINVEVRECQPLAAPANSNFSCTMNNVEGSVCTVSCNHGYRLQGQADLTCLDTEKWNAEVPTCEAIICPGPPSIARGHFSCPHGRQHPAECTLTCEAGYEVKGHTTLQCSQFGNWTTPGTCADVEPPVFESGCQDNIEVYAASLGLQTFVHVTAPTARDNSEDAIQITSDINTREAFPPGVTVVTFEATDSSGNMISCSKNITVTVLQCNEPDLQPVNATEVSPMQESCPDGHVHGARCTLICTHGYRLQGRDTITCERDDSTHPPTMSWKWSGDEAVRPRCREDKCPPLVPPKNGAFSCYLGNHGWECVMSCESSWDVPAQTEWRYVCPNDWQYWTPSTVPDCVVRTRPGRVRMMADLLYFTGSCNVSVEQLRHNFMACINQTILAGACSLTSSCVAENVEVMCRPAPSRLARHADFDDAVLTRIHRARRDVNRVTSHVVSVAFHVTMPYKEDSNSPEDVYKSYQEEANKFIGHLRSQVNSGLFNMDDLDLVADESGLGNPVLKADCPPGTRDNKIVRPQTRFSCVPK